MYFLFIEPIQVILICEKYIFCKRDLFLYKKEWVGEGVVFRTMPKCLLCLFLYQAGKHEAIVKNVHDLLAKLAWDFSPEQLDHLFDCFKESWTHASKKQREKLLELIRRLAEDDKDGVMAHKVLNLLWNLAHSDDVPVDIMDQALSAHIKILDYSCSQVKLQLLLLGCIH